MKVTEITTQAQADEHFENCKGLIKCLHDTKRVNEYGDCFLCDGEGERMCDCQTGEEDWWTKIER